VLTGLDGRAFDADAPFLNRLLEHQPGEQVTFDVLRDGEHIQLQVILGTRPSA
jgi:S1-C subfamily serine protease